MPEEKDQFAGAFNKKSGGKTFTMVGIVAIIVIIIALAAWFLGGQMKSYKMVYSDKDNQKVYLVYVQPKKINDKLVSQIMKDVQAKATVLEKKEPNKANFRVAVKVYDDKSYVVVDKKAQEKATQDQANLKPEEKAMAFQKKFEEELKHMVLTSTNANNWKATYGPNYQSLRK